MNPKTQLPVLTFMLLTTLSLTACVTQGTYDKLLDEHNALREQSKNLAQRYAIEQGKGSNKARESERLKHALADTTDELSATSEQLAAIKARTEKEKKIYSSLVKELSSELDSQKITIEKMKNGINVNLKEDILFASGSASIRPSGEEVLKKVSAQLRTVPYQIIVSGFTDNVPIKGKLAKRYPSNWDLAAARATNVVRLLESNQVPGDNLTAASFGKNQPISSNDSAEGRKKNRRIEIRLRPRS